MNTRRNLQIALILAGAVMLNGIQCMADFITEILADDPLVYLRMQETNVGDGTKADNLGWEAGDFYYRLANGTDGSFTDVASMSAGSSPGKGFVDQAYIEYAPWSFAAQSELSIEFMLKPENFTGGLQSIFSADDWQAAGAVHLNLVDNQIEFWMMDIGETPKLNLASHIDAGEWAHIVLTYAYGAGGTSLLNWYVNGAAAGEHTGLLAGTTDVSLPASIAAWANTRYLNHSLDEFAIYDKVLSSADVERHYLAIPEPSTMAMFIGGLCIWAFQRLRRGRA